MRLALSCRWWLRFYTWHNNWREDIATLLFPPDNLRIRAQTRRPWMFSFEDILLCLVDPLQLPAVLARNLPRSATRRLTHDVRHPEHFAKVLAGNVGEPTNMMRIKQNADEQTHEEQQEDKKKRQQEVRKGLQEVQKKKQKKRSRESSASFSSSSSSSSSPWESSSVIVIS